MPCLSLSLKFHYLARIISYFWPFDVIFRNKIPGKLKPPRHRFLSLSWMSISQQKPLFFILHNSRLCISVICLPWNAPVFIPVDLYVGIMSLKECSSLWRQLIYRFRDMGIQESFFSIIKYSLYQDCFLTRYRQIQFPQHVLEFRQLLQFQRLSWFCLN